MARRHVVVVLGLRLAVYTAALMAVLAAAEPHGAARFDLSTGTAGPSLILPVTAVILAGVILEILVEALRWR